MAGVPYVLVASQAQYASVDGAEAQVARARYECRRNALLARADDRLLHSAGGGKSPGVNIGGG